MQTQIVCGSFYYSKKFHVNAFLCVCMYVCVVYLLDDPLSAMDSHVGAGLFAKGIIGSLRNRGKGIVLGNYYFILLKKKKSNPFVFLMT